MECKGFLRISRTFSAMDLIDTLWNVKCFAVVIADAGVADLIDTLWNVKY